MYKICKQCGKRFETYQHNVFLCSKKCANERMKRQVTLTCHWCEASFERIRHKAKGKKRVFCSPDCHQKWMHSLNPPKECPVCHNEFKPPSSHPDQVFCSQRCWYDFKTKAIEVPCDNCGKPIKVTPFRLEYAERHFCSKECLHKGFSGENGPAWRGGHAKYKGPNWERQSLKCRKRDNFVCQSCDAVESDQSFHAHHRTPYRLFEGDWTRANRLSNLVTLCPSCHSTIEMAITHGHIDTIPENCRPLKSHRHLVQTQLPLLSAEFFQPGQS